VDTAFGNDFVAGASAEYSLEELGRAFDLCTKRVRCRFFDRSWRMKRFFNVGDERAYRQSLLYLKGFLDKAITQCMNDTSTERCGATHPVLDRQFFLKASRRVLVGCNWFTLSIYCV